MLEISVYKQLIALSFFAFFSLAAAAEVTVTAPWARATVASQKSSGAFLQLQSSKATRLVAASSPLAGRVELHEMSMQNNVMSMRALSAIDLPAGQLVELRPGAFHVMLFDLRQPLKAGDKLPLTLEFDDGHNGRESITVQAEIRELNADMMHHH